MTTDCNILTPLQRDGTSRANRSIETLQPSTILIDGRSLADFAQYISQLSTLIRFYDEKNTISGNWQPFFKDDVSFLTAQIAKADYRTYANTYAPLIRLDKNDIAAQWADFFTPTLDIISQLDGWYKQSTEGLSIQAALYRLNVSVLIEATTQMVAIAKRREETEVGLPLPKYSEAVLKQWLLSLSFSNFINFSTIQSDKSLFKNTPLTADDYDVARKKLKTIFGRCYQALFGIVQTAPQYLEDSLTHYPQHKPHVALFWAFLKLLEYVKADINALSARHLDFYYREVLQLQAQAPVPDSVHAIFELARNFVTYEVQKGTYLKDGKDALGVDILFKTDQTFIVNNLTLDTEGLKNVFVETEKVGNNQTIKNIYAAPKANTADGFAVPPTNGQWRAFGNAAMPYANIGFAIASPQLLLQEGIRTLNFVFYFKELFDSPQKLRIENEIKNNVNVFLTGLKGWVLANIEEVILIDIDEQYRVAAAKYESDIVNNKIEILWLNKTLPPGQNVRNKINQLILERDTVSTLSDELDTVNQIAAISPAKWQ